MRFDLRRLIYAAGNYGKNILWGTAEITLLFMLTDMLGIRPAMAGLILLASLAVDAALDPMMGRIADRLRTPLGRYGPMILVGAPLSAFSFSALYALPLLGVSNIWIVAGLVMAFRVSYSLIDLPHNALMTQVTGDSRARARLSGYRFGFSSLASLTLALSLAPMVEDETRKLSASGLATFAVTVSLISMVVMIASWWVVRRRDAASAGQPAESLPTRVALAALFSSPPYRIALIAGCLATLTLPLFSKSLIYMAIHILGDPQAASRLLTMMVIGQFVGLPLWIALPSRWEKATSLQLAHTMTVLGLISLAICLYALPVAAPGASILVGIGASGVYTIIWGMVADCVEDVAARSGKRPEGLLFALAIFGQKAAMAIGVGIYGFSLQFAGYDPAVQGSAASTLVILGFAFVSPLLGSLIAVWLLSHYDLTHTRHVRLTGS